MADKIELDADAVQAAATAIHATAQRMDAVRYQVRLGKRERFFDVYQPKLLRAQAEAAIRTYLRKAS